MRPRAACLLTFRLLTAALLLLALAPCPRAARAAAGPFPPPPDPAQWSPGPAGSRATPALGSDAAVRAPSGAASLRLEFNAAPGPANQARGASAGDASLACLVRRVQADLSGARGLEFSVRADRPLAARLTMQSTNVETHVGTDRFYGSFVVGRDWKTLRIAFRTLAPDATWQADVAGDRVLRPDNVEEIRICVEAGRLDAGGGTLWLGDVRFFQ